MKVELNERGRGWGKGLAACALFLAIAVFFLALGIYHSETVAIVVGAIGTVLFGAFAVMLANPNMLSCMQMVKGEMTYQQLKAAVEAEDFDSPIRFLQKAARPGLLLASENWIVVEDHGKRVYVPKRKVRRIELEAEPVEFGPEHSGDGQTYLHYFYYFKFTCDERHAFATGLFPREGLFDALEAVQKHFPDIIIEEAHGAQILTGNEMVFNLFKKPKAKKAVAVDRFPEEPRDGFKSKEYYLEHLKRIERWLAEIEDKVRDDPDARGRSYIITEGHRRQRVCLLYVLRADEQEVRDAALDYLRNLRGLACAQSVGERSELTGNLVYRALAFATLFDFEHEEVSFLDKDIIDDRYVDAAMDMLRSALFRGEASTDKDFYFKDTGYFGDVTKGTDGLLLAIRTEDQKERTAEFVKFLEGVKEKHHQRLLKHYEEVGEQRYVYTGSYDFRLTAVAKVLGIDKDAVADSKFIAADLM